MREATIRSETTVAKAYDLYVVAMERGDRRKLRP